VPFVPAMNPRIDGREKALFFRGSTDVVGCKNSSAAAGAIDQRERERERERESAWNGRRGREGMRGGNDCRSLASVRKGIGSRQFARQGNACFGGSSCGALLILHFSRFDELPCRTNGPNAKAAARPPPPPPAQPAIRARGRSSRFGPVS